MMVVILAGGRGTRLSEETQSRPKPMGEIGGRPILWHLMSVCASHGHRRNHMVAPSGRTASHALTKAS